MEVILWLINEDNNVELINGGNNGVIMAVINGGNNGGNNGFVA